MDLDKYKPNREFLLYKTDSGEVKVDVLLQNKTIWMPQKSIAELFDVNVPAVSKHLKNIFDSGELDKKVVVSILEIPTQLRYRTIVSCGLKNYGMRCNRAPARACNRE